MRVSCSVVSVDVTVLGYVIIAEFFEINFDVFVVLNGRDRVASCVVFDVKMGTAISANIDLSTNEYLLRFASKEHLSPNDPFWNRFLAFNIVLPASR